MRHVIYFLVSLLVAVGAAFFLREMLTENGDPGYVHFVYRTWSVEMSLFVFGVLLLFGFILFYFAVRIVAGLLKLPGKIKMKGAQIRDSRSQQALIAGLLDSAEGNWEKAERMLIKHASDSGAPLIHYLTAARAAHSRGAVEKRDEYLRLAYESSPDAQVAVGLTQAELHLSRKEFDNALESLSRLKSIAPGHASVLRLMHQTYEQLEDWEGLRKLIPALHKHKVLMEAEIKLLETETFSALLKKSAEQGDSAALKALWESVPTHVRQMPGVEALYYAAMIESGAGSDIEGELTATLSREWNQTLVVLYGCIESADAVAQREVAEAWLKEHPRDAVLLRVLGKLSLRSGDTARSERFLVASVGAEPSVEAYELLGDLFAERGEPNKANQCYKRGLQLASSEVVKHVEDFSGNYLEEIDEAEPEAAP